jgi:hypothetical protein
MAKGIYVIAEQRDGALRKVSFELVSAARKLADQTSDEVCAILLGSGVESMAAELGKFGADKVFVGDNAALEPYITEAHAQVVAKILKDNEAAIALFGASVQGKDLSARVAAKLAAVWRQTAPTSRLTAGNSSPFVRCTPVNASAKWPSIPLRRWHRFVPMFSRRWKTPKPALSPRLTLLLTLRRAKFWKCRKTPAARLT